MVACSGLGALGHGAQDALGEAGHLQRLAHATSRAKALVWQHVAQNQFVFVLIAVKIF